MFVGGSISQSQRNKAGETLADLTVLFKGVTISDAVALRHSSSNGNMSNAVTILSMQSGSIIKKQSMCDAARLYR